MSATTTRRKVGRPPTVDVWCLNCYARLPGEHGAHDRAREHGWSRIYRGPDGTGFRCPSCRAERRSS